MRLRARVNFLLEDCVSDGVLLSGHVTNMNVQQGMDADIDEQNEEGIVGRFCFAGVKHIDKVHVVCA